MLRAPTTLEATRRPAAIGEKTQRRLLYILLALGIFFRLFHFFDNRSFFIDELFLNINVVKMDFGQLATLPFEYEQKAPLGYLWSVRSFVALFGKQEQALRLFSLLCGIASLLFFWPVARFFLKSWGAVVAVGLLALAYPAVYHSVEAKQYSAELLATIVSLYLYTRYRDKATLLAALSWGVLGGLLLWFSFPTIFVLAGIGMVVCLSALVKKDWKRFGLYLLSCTLWLVSFGLVYYFFVSKFHDSGWLSYFFKIKYEGYLPLTTAPALAKWLAFKAYDFLDHPMGLLLDVDNTQSYFGLKHVLKMGWLYLLCGGIGACFLLTKRKQYFIILFVPLGLALAASALAQYPFYQRFTLFLAPLIMLVIGYGAQIGSQYLPSSKLTYILVGLLLAPPLVNSAHQVVDTSLFYNREYYRDAVFFVNDNFQSDDAVYVYWNMRQGYEYYKQAYPLRYTAIRGSFAKNESSNQAEYLQNLQKDFGTFKGKKRLWFVYDVNNRDAIGDYVDKPAWYHDKAYPPGRLLHEYFSQLGRKVQQVQKGNCVVVLYELNQ